MQHDALALASYEAKKWKEKYMEEKTRRRSISRSMLELMVLPEHSHDHESQSSVSESGPIGTLLSPTLSSFDFDDDDDEGAESASDRDSEEEKDELHQLSRGSVSSTDDYGARETLCAPRRPDDAVDATRRTGNVAEPYAVAVRPSRSSTIGDASGAGRYSERVRAENNHSHPMMIYRMLYAKSSSRDLWQTGTHPTRLHSVAKSVMFSMHLKKEHIYEQFFTVGVSFGPKERENASVAPAGLVGHWKPRVLREYPPRPHGAQAPTVADFCFPMGVPVFQCSSSEADQLVGTVISKWSTDAESVQKEALEPFRSSGYTFRLTGANGEVLYGFCVAVIMEIDTHDQFGNHSTPSSPRNDFTKRASFPSMRFAAREESFSYRRKYQSEGHDTSGNKVLAPVCFCFTSKFPFYRFHFSVLRIVIENELRTLAEQHAQQGSAKHLRDFEVAVRSAASLSGVEFGVCRQENLRATAWNSERCRSGLSSICSGVRVVAARATLSEDTPVLTKHAGIHTPGEASPLASPQGMRKSFSSDDISLVVNAVDGCVIEKPVVKKLSAPGAKELNLEVGDVLEAIEGIATASLSQSEAMTLLKRPDFPKKLRFVRSCPNKNSLMENDAQLIVWRNTVDILARVRTLRINEPGSWSSVRLPHFQLDYQFPKLPSERWSVGVALRTLTPESITTIMTFLLLEKQVVIMADSPALATSLCTAFLILLSPFQWQSTYIPLLPSNLLDFLHSPVPFLAGCHQLDSSDEWPEVCFFDADQNQLSVPPTMHHINQTFVPNGIDLCRLFSRNQGKIRSLRQMSKPWHEITDEEDSSISSLLGETEKLLRSMCGDLANVDLSPTPGKSFYDRLQEEMLKQARKSSSEEFLEEFSETQMFCQYFESILKPSANGS
ncbi:TPA: hypothetical protein N0F65_002416 [Lagenidium giganteum]|uniref:UDENN domain-containing protein n=1 Tax=Lagenidium giganteum TaxID=4803 RepID=A0AAV2YLV5_9STRA|nr:TPA: hypothetical protein N0F65_002416 [Lagenidium giganteum]